MFGISKKFMRDLKAGYACTRSCDQHSGPKAASAASLRRSAVETSGTGTGLPAFQTFTRTRGRSRHHCCYLQKADRIDRTEAGSILMTTHELSCSTRKSIESSGCRRR